MVIVLAGVLFLVVRLVVALVEGTQLGDVFFVGVNLFTASLGLVGREVALSSEALLVDGHLVVGWLVAALLPCVLFAVVALDRPVAERIFIASIPLGGILAEGAATFSDDVRLS